MPEKSFTLPSFAKINLFLRVFGKREDGFHELCTVFQTVSLHDDITFATADGLRFTCSDPNIPAGDDNLIVRAAKALREKYGIKAGADIHLEKKRSRRRAVSAADRPMRQSRCLGWRRCGISILILRRWKRSGRL